jgi:hypothetical protein
VRSDITEDPGVLTSPHATRWEDSARTTGDQEVIKVGLFNRKKPKVIDQAVIVHYDLSDDEYGQSKEREAVFRLEDRLESLIETHQVGEFDGNEFGGGEAVLYSYGPDADRLFAVIEQELRSFTARPAYATLRYGDVADPSTTERRVDL